MDQGPFRRAARRPAVIGAVLLAAVAAIAVLAPIVTGDPLRPDLEHGLDSTGAPLAPSAHWPLGTDALGRDVWARLAHGAGHSLWVAGLATAVASMFGATVGVIAGYRGGAVDDVAMRSVDVALTVPALLLAALLAAVMHSAGVDQDRALIVTLAALGWTTSARVIRGQVRIVRGSDYVLAARALGAGATRVIVRHIMPAVGGLLAAVTTLALAQNLILEAALGYLGLGAPPPAPSWGRMLAEGQPHLTQAPWLVLAPGLAIVITITAANLLGNGLRNALDPRLG